MSIVMVEVVDSCCVGQEGGEIEDGGDGVIHHHLGDEKHRSDNNSSIFMKQNKNGAFLKSMSGWNLVQRD